MDVEGGRERTAWCRRQDADVVEDEEVQHLLVVTAVLASVGAAVGTASLILDVLFRLMSKLR